MKFFFVDRVKNIWDVSKIKGVSVDFAFDRFYADVVNGVAMHDNTAMDSYDFAADKAVWDTFSEDEQKVAIAIYKDFATSMADEICAALADEDPNAINAVIDAFKAKVEANA